MRLLLARHGQSLWNQVRKFQGANDIGLSDLGRTQADALGIIVESTLEWLVREIVGD